MNSSCVLLIPHTGAVCDHHDDLDLALGAGRPTGLSRRTLLRAGAGALAGLGGLRAAGPARAALPARAAVRNAAGVRSWRSAMHVHTSLSEMTGSVESQVTQAALHGFDVLHLSDHDARAYKRLFRTSYGFTPGELQYGGAWDVKHLQDLGRPVAPVSGLVSSPTSPYADRSVPQGALRLSLSAGRGRTASTCYQLVNGFTPGATGTRANWNGTVTGDRYTVDVLLAQAGAGAWGDVVITLSDHPATGGRPGGVRRLHYRLRTDVAARRWTPSGLTGLVDVPVPRGVWTTVELDLVNDAAALWPDSDPRDNALNGTQFWATARNGGTADVYFADLRRTPLGDYDPIGLQRSMLDRLAPLAPALRTYPGFEYSYDDQEHINGFGGSRTPFDYDSLPNTSRRPLYPDYGPGLAPALVQHIHDSGGLASLNHLLGYVPHATRSAAEQAAATKRAVVGLLANGAAGADLLEVGYRQRGGFDLEHQLWLFDAMTRNGVWITGNGTSVEHTGLAWDAQTNRAYTSTWAATTDEADQLAALRAGRAFVGFLGDFDGTLDLRLDSGPMGSISVSTRTRRQLRIDVTGLPQGGAVEVVRIAVDRAGAADPTPGSQVVARLSAAALAQPFLQVDTAQPVAYRVNVVDAGGQVVAFSQPCWSLPRRPPTPIPAARAAPDTLPG